MINYTKSFASNNIEKLSDDINVFCEEANKAGLYIYDIKYQTTYHHGMRSGQMLFTALVLVGGMCI